MDWYSWLRRPWKISWQMMGWIKAKGPVEHLVSAGGVVYRYSDQGMMEVVLCGQNQPLSWRLPKGTPDAGESLEETAQREAEEETGLKVNIETRLGQISYWFVKKGLRNHKTVHFYLMSVAGGDVSQHDPEFDEVRWFPWEEAEAKLTYKVERDILHQAKARLSEVAK